MRSPTESPATPFSPVLYLVAGMLIVTPLLGMLALLPLQPSAQTWRFSAEGLLANLLLLPLVGVALAMLTAAALDDRRVLRALAILNAFAGFAFVVLLVRLGLDALELRHALVLVQTRGLVRSSGVRGFDANVLKSASEYAVAIIVAAVFSWHGWRRSRIPRAARARRATGASPLVVASMPAEVTLSSSLEVS